MKTMGNREKVIACFQELGFKLNIAEFRDRLIAQKLVCLLELKGVNTGYPCSIYVRGPYSPDLTKDLFDHMDEFVSFQTKVSLTPEESEKVRELKRLFGLSPNLLEVGATFGYFLNKDLDPGESLKRLKQLKPFLSEKEIAVGVSKSKQYLFTPSEEDIEELKKETMAWQNASINSMKE